MNLREFSDFLGLSPTTVSRALGGYPEVSEGTRARVTKAAKEHGYRPNRQATALATGRSMAIGHVIPLARDHDMVNPVFADFIAGAGEVYAEAGYDMLISVVPDAQEADAYRQMARNRSVDGVIVHAPRAGDPRIDLLRETGMPFLVHGRVPDRPEDYDFLDVDNIRAFRRATELLLDQGHRRIALINGLETLDFARRRCAGYLAALAARGLEPDPRHMAQLDMSDQEGHRVARAMLDVPKPPTAFLSASLIMSYGIRRAVQDTGLTLGTDVAIVTHDDMLSYLANGGDVPIFTATRSSVRAAGRRCAQMLIDRIADPNADPKQEVWESDLVEGESTNPPPFAPRGDML